MEKKQYLEAGKIINTHGVRGELKVEAWTDAPAVLAELKTLYLEGQPRRVEGARVHKGFVLLKLEGIDSVEEAMALKGRVLTARREDIPLEPGAWFLQDALGQPVADEEGKELGVLADILEYPAGRIYVVKGEAEHLIPEQGGFIRGFDPESGRLTVRLIEGM